LLNVNTSAKRREKHQWIAARQSELLPVPYVHVVFTLPHYLSPLALVNKEVIYELLFRATAETLLEVAVVVVVGADAFLMLN